jgi:hypothetical protein
MSFIGGDPSQQVFERLAGLPGSSAAWRITSLMEVLRSLRTNDHPARQGLGICRRWRKVHQSTRKQFRLGRENTSKRHHVKYEISARTQEAARKIVCKAFDMVTEPLWQRRRVALTAPR